MVTPWESQSYFIESLSSYRYALKTTVVIDRVWNEKMQDFFLYTHTMCIWVGVSLNVMSRSNF